MLENWPKQLLTTLAFILSSQTGFKMFKACGGRSNATFTFVITEKLAAIFPWVTG